MVALGVEAWFQPIIALADGTVTGFEALARPPGGGTVTDGAWLGTGGLAETMLTQSARALSAWREVPGRAGLTVQVNLTGEDLKLDHLPVMVATVRRRYGLAPGALLLEITEGVPIGDMAAAVSALLAVKAAGAGLVLDDFGSGYSSLAWLHDLPVDGLKIDGELTGKLGSARGNVILAHTVALGHALGLSVTAEGVEDAGQGEALKVLGVDRVQGFAYGRPMAAGEADRWLAGGRAGRVSAEGAGGKGAGGKDRERDA